MRTSVRKSILKSAVLLGTVGVGAIAIGQIGCSAGAPGESSLGPSAGEETGSLGMQLTLPGGEQISVVTWTVTGPNGASTTVQTGTVNVANSTSVQFLVGGIPAGASYLISLSGTSVDGTVTCAGAASFSTQARTTTNVSVNMLCASTTPEAGSALVTANTFNCGSVTAVNAMPAEVIAGNAVAVSASATGPNPGGLTYQWSAPSGSFDNPNSPNANYTCSADGGTQVTLTVSVSDGAAPAGSSCPAASSTVQVTCDGHVDQAAKLATATKIKHLIVIFNENISFDHYFGTYPTAQNNSGEIPFLPAPGTPVPNNLVQPLDPTNHFAPITGVNLLSANPTAANLANGASAVNPFRLSALWAETSSQNHNYQPEQQAADNGKMDLSPEYTGKKGPPPGDGGTPLPPAPAMTTGLVMAYYDGNTLSTYWNLAQQYALSDNMWTTNFGPSTPGAINLISGMTSGIGATNHPLSAFNTGHVAPDGNGGYSLIGDTDPFGDACSTAADQNTFVGKNVGDLLNNKSIPWGWFNGGFNLGATNTNNTTGCSRSTPQTVPYSTVSADYVPHHQPFQYYASTANLTHARPSSIPAIGSSVETDGVTPEPANHQYDTTDFFAALTAGNLPAVVYLKAPSFEDGHPGNSNPVDEQNFVANVVSALQGAQEWSSSAIVVTYDDSDGWYDHQAPPIVNPSTGVADALNGVNDAGIGVCNSGAQQNGPAPAQALPGLASDGGATGPAQSRCGYGTRVPMLVISPFAKKNYIDHTLIDQSSVVRFVEDNWLGGQRIGGGSFDVMAGSIQNLFQGI